MTIDKKILEIAQSVEGKRPKTVINHIIEHGFITNDDLKDTYGYNHPPRAIRDVREQGIPLETFKVTGKDGRKIGAYRFGNPEEIEAHKLGGRKTFSKAFKQRLVEAYGELCWISSEKYDERYLQIDHRIPYEIAGDEQGDEFAVEKFMLLSGAAQRQKSWSCENCVNLLTIKNPEICKECYWAYPERYTHVALKQERRVDLIFSGENIDTYEKIAKHSSGESIQSAIMNLLKKSSLLK